MPNAFLNLNEPHAWLIRGLVEYGWQDMTGRGGAVPPGAPGGFDVSRITGSQGKDGIVLVMAPVVDGRMADDSNYEFEVKVTGRAPNIRVVARCPDCNYLEEFPYDLQSPQHAAGYLHQGVTKHVPEFVRWRLGGGELTWAQREGVPPVDGDPCSGELVKFLSVRLRQPSFSFNQGPAEGWWLSGDVSVWGKGPVAQTGKGGGDPVYISAAGRAELASMGGANANVERVAALDLVDRPGGFLGMALWLCMAFGVISLLNVLVTVYFFGTNRMVQTVGWFVFGGALIGLGLLSRKGLARYREVRDHWTVYLMLAYVALTPVCCLWGLPLSVWALLVWIKPEVRAGRLRF